MGFDIHIGFIENVYKELIKFNYFMLYVLFGVVAYLFLFYFKR